MLFLLIIALIITLIVYLLYTRPVKLEFLFSSGEMEMKFDALWLGFIRIRAERVNYKTHIAAYVFKARVYSGYRKKTGGGFNTDMLRVLSLSDTEVKTRYGLDEPHITGILFGALSAVASMANLNWFEQYTDFVPAEEYLEIEGSSKLNIGKTATNYLRLNQIRERGENTMDQLALTNNVDSLFHTLENLTQKEGIIGKAVTHGDKTFLPVVSITVGYGTGSASMGKGQSQSGSSMSMSSSSSGQSSGTGALGLGAKICTDAVIVIDAQNNQSVTMLPVSSAAGSLMDKIPQILSGMNQNKQQNQSGNQGQS